MVLPFFVSCFHDYHFNYGIKRRNLKVTISACYILVHD